MKPTTFSSGRILLIILAAALTIGLVSWGHRQSPNRYDQPINDTTPKKKSGDKKIRDLDDVINELDKADLNINMEKIQKEIAEAMKQLDGEKIRLDIEKAMKEVDVEKIRKEVKESMAKMDWNKMKEEISNAMKEVDMARIQKEVQESIAKIDFEKIKTEIERVKEIDMKKVQEEMEKVKEEMKDLGPRLEKELAKAKEEIEKARAEIKEYKEFVNGLESDGLIDKKKNYTLKHKDGELFINGKKASEQTYSKYRSFLEKHKKFNIEKDEDDFEIDMD